MCMLARIDFVRRFRTWSGMELVENLLPLDLAVLVRPLQQ